MEGSYGSTAPFLLKTYEMVDDPFTKSIVSWSHTGQSFVVWNPPDFSRDLLPKYFKHNNFSSFIRQLNTYGFRKVDPDQWEFANDEFIRGRRHLLKNIQRRKPVHSHSGQGNAAPLAESERGEFEKEIQNLEQEKDLLRSEMERRQMENQGYAHQLRSLGQTLDNIDHRQQQLAATLSRLLHNPKHVSRESEPHGKKRRLSSLDYIQDQVGLGSSSVPLLNLESVAKLDSLLTFWEKFLHGVDQIEVSRDLNIVDQTEVTPECRMSVSPPHPKSPADIDRGADMNSTPAGTPEVEVIEEQEWDGDIASVPAGGNDTFWEQFLRDTPASSRMRQPQDLYAWKDSGGQAQMGCG